MVKCLKIPAPTGVFVFDLTEALQDGLGGFFRYSWGVVRQSFFVGGPSPVFFLMCFGF